MAAFGLLLGTVEMKLTPRLIEVFAGFTERADYNAGRMVDEIDRLGYSDNMLIFCLWGDNGSSAEGQNRTISELLTQKSIPSSISHHITALNELGGFDVLGLPRINNLYHAAWAWAGSKPYQSTKPVTAHFDGTRQPMAVRWPKKIKRHNAPRSQFLHVIDVTQTNRIITTVITPRPSTPGAGR